MKKKLGIDLDDVLYPFSEKFCEFANSRLGKSVTVADMTTYRLDLVYQTSYDVIMKLIEEFFTAPETLTYDPIPGAVDGINELSKHYELHIITARKDVFACPTSDWINKHFPGKFSSVQYCNFYALCPNQLARVTKAMKCRELDLLGIVDDNAENVAGVLLSGRAAILFGDYPWHSEMPKHIRAPKAETWGDVLTMHEEFFSV